MVQAAGPNGEQPADGTTIPPPPPPHREPTRPPRYKKAKLEACRETSDDDVLSQFLSRALAKATPTLRPSEDEFVDTFSCIRKVEVQAGRCGVCKIVPPQAFAGGSLTTQEILSRVEGIEFSSVTQKIWQGTWTDFHENCVRKDEERTSPAAFLEKNNELAKSLNLGNKDGATEVNEIECEYWRICGRAPGAKFKDDYVVQSNAAVGSAFTPSDKLSETRWNFKTLKDDEAMLFRNLGSNHGDLGCTKISLGCLFGTSFWKRHHGNFHSLEYLHGGWPRIWYVVPPEYGNAVEEIIIRQVYRKAMGKMFKRGKTWDEARRKAFRKLSSSSTMFLPSKLIHEGVPVFRVVQAPGEIISILPGSFHMAFSTGFNCYESVSLATPEWLFHGERSINRSRTLGIPIRIPYEEMLCKEAILIGLSLKNNGAPSQSQVLVMRKLTEFLKEQQLMRKILSQRGVIEGQLEGFLISGNCSRCNASCFLGMVKKSDESPPLCLHCATRDEGIGHGGVLFIKKEISELENMSKGFQTLLANRPKCYPIPILGFLNTPEAPLRLVEHIAINCLNGFRDRRVFISPSIPAKAYVIAADVILAMGMKNAEHDEMVMIDIWMEVNRSFDALRISPPPFPLKAYFEGANGEVTFGVVLSSTEVDVILKTVQGAAFIGLSQFIAGIRSANVAMGGGVVNNRPK